MIKIRNFIAGFVLIAAIAVANGLHAKKSYKLTKPKLKAIHSPLVCPKPRASAPHPKITLPHPQKRS